MPRTPYAFGSCRAHPRRVAWFVLATLAPLLVGCGQGTCTSYYLDDEYGPLFWVVASLLASSALGIGWMFSLRARQLGSWNLRRNPTAPSVVSLVVGLVALFLLLLAGHLGLNFYCSVDSQLLVINVLSVTVGGLLGASAGAYLGLALAERPWR